MAKTAAQATAKWTASTQVGQATWLANLQGTQKPIASAAVAARALMQTNFSRATQPGGPWETHLLAVGDAGIKAAAAAKQANYGLGVTQGEGHYATAIGKIINFEAAGQAGLAAIPKGQSIARVTYWVNYMASGRGTLGAK